MTFLTMQKNSLIKKAYVNFEIYEVINRNSNKYNKHIARYLKK